MLFNKDNNISKISFKVEKTKHINNLNHNLLKMAKKEKKENKGKEEKISKELILKNLKEVIDPEIGLSIVDMKLIKNVKIEGNDVFIKMTLTTPFCPLASFIVESVKQKVKSIKGVGKVEVEVVF